MAQAESVWGDKLPYYCFDIILSAMACHSLPVNTRIGRHRRCGGLFVTWDKVGRHGSFELRGCIGRLSDIGVLEGIETYAKQSAFRDTRFDPITLKEVSQLRCSVSLLHKFEDADDVFDWDLKIHGIIINFSVSGQKYSATYLPQIALEQGWTKQEAIDSLVCKSGYRRTINDKFRKRISVTRYQSAKTKATYDEYCRVRVPIASPKPKPLIGRGRDAKRIRRSVRNDRRQYVR
jgi:uncharacterized protein (TIGR00296 family)